MIISDSPILNFSKPPSARRVEVFADAPGYLFWFRGLVWVPHNRPELWVWLSENDDPITSEAMALIEWRGERAA